MTERALALAMVRIAKLEDENASTFGGQARHIAELEATLAQERRTYASVAEQLKARIAELEAERDKWKEASAAWEAERNRLKTERGHFLATLNDWHDVPPEHESEPIPFHKGWELAVRSIRAALSGEGVTP